jgi:hypothetical protein
MTPHDSAHTWSPYDHNCGDRQDGNKHAIYVIESRRVRLRRVQGNQDPERDLEKIDIRTTMRLRRMQGD